MNKIKTKLSLFLLIFSILIHNADAQLMKEKINFTYQDTLRGMLNADRSWWDVIHYALKVQPDFRKFTISGSNTITFKIIGNVGERMQIDLQSPMQIDEVYLDNNKVTFFNEGNVWYVRLTKNDLQNISGKRSTKMMHNLHQLTINFHGVPKPALHPPWDGGVVWQKDGNGNPWIGVACQGLGASSWWPCKDHQSDKPDSASIEVRVPDSLMNISNGRLTSLTKHADQTSSWKWNVSNPINSYNLTMNVGKYAHWSDTMMGEKGILTIDYYVLENEVEKAKKQFAQTKPMLKAFEYWFGPYPFYEDGYKIIQTSYLGMEHQSAIAYGNNFVNGYKGEDLSKTGQGLKWDFILVHESGHEWYGNNINSKDLADMWIHEGFTNYAECLYMNEVFGKSEANEYIIGLRDNVLNDKPIIGPYNVNTEGSADMYYKASNMLHTIRHVIYNDSIFRNLLRKMNQQYKFGSVTTQEIESFIIQETGKNLKKIFDQYLRTTQIPTLEYFLEQTTEKHRLFYRWSNVIDGFNMPVRLPISLKGYEWVIPDRSWKSIAVIDISNETLGNLLDNNFYIEYKVRKP